ncbi:MAG: hypothetical protein ACU84J_14835 [Gammaproteobacteria bacterium]
MNIKLIKLLGTVCSALLLVITAEWQYARYAKKKLISEQHAQQASGYTDSKLPQLELLQQPEDSFSEMVNRPLFIEGRRPVFESEDETEEAAVPMEKFDWQLDGVYLHEKTTMALFSNAKNRTRQEKFLKKSLGEEIEGWRLTGIEPGKVLLEQGGQKQELLLRKPKPTKPSPPTRAIPPAVQGTAPKPVEPSSQPSPPDQVKTQNPFLIKSNE